MFAVANFLVAVNRLSDAPWAPEDVGYVIRMNAMSVCECSSVGGLLRQEN